MDKLLGPRMQRSVSDYRLMLADAELELEAAGKERQAATLDVLEGREGGEARKAKAEKRYAAALASVQDLRAAMTAAQVREEEAEESATAAYQAIKEHRTRDLVRELRSQTITAEARLQEAAEALHAVLRARQELLQHDGSFEPLFAEITPKLQACVLWQLRGVVRTSTFKPEPHERWSDYLPNRDQENNR